MRRSRAPRRGCEAVGRSRRTLLRSRIVMGDGIKGGHDTCKSQIIFDTGKYQDDRYVQPTIRDQGPQRFAAQPLLREARRPRPEIMKSPLSLSGGGVPIVSWRIVTI